MTPNLRIRLRQVLLGSSINRLLASLRIRNARMVLHVGAFSSPFAVALRDEGFEVTVTDLLLDRCRPARFVQADARALPFRVAAFDTVVIPFVLHAVSQADRHQILREAHRCLKLGGVVAVIDFPDASDVARASPWVEIWQYIEEVVIGLRDRAHFGNFRQYRRSTFDVATAGTWKLIDSSVSRVNVVTKIYERS